MRSCEKWWKLSNSWCKCESVVEKSLSFFQKNLKIYSELLLNELDIMLIKENLSTEKKVNIIFSYLFSDEKSREEEFFWNELSAQECEDLEKIQWEKVYDFEWLKNSILWK